MALLQVNYYSDVLKRNVPLAVVLPVDRCYEEKEYRH